MGKCRPRANNKPEESKVSDASKSPLKSDAKAVNQPPQSNTSLNNPTTPGKGDAKAGTNPMENKSAVSVTSNTSKGPSGQADANTGALNKAPANNTPTNANGTGKQPGLRDSNVSATSKGGNEMKDSLQSVDIKDLNKSVDPKKSKRIWSSPFLT